MLRIAAAGSGGNGAAGCEVCDVILARRESESAVSDRPVTVPVRANACWSLRAVELQVFALSIGGVAALAAKNLFFLARIHSRFSALLSIVHTIPRVPD